MNTRMQELSEHELACIEGGWGILWPVMTALGGMAAGAIIDGWSEFKDGFQDAFWNQQNLAN